MSAPLGRTNKAFPKAWFSLRMPHTPGHSDWAARLAASAAETEAPVDVTSHPGLWGAALRGRAATVMAIVGDELEEAPTRAHGEELMQARLIQLLSAVGRDRIDLLFLRVRRALDEAPAQGALETFETARQDGHIGHLGVCCEGPGLATLALWQCHDAFEMILLPRNPLTTEPYETLAPLARERRVGIVTRAALDWGRGAAFCELLEPSRMGDLARSFTSLSLAQAALAHSMAEHPVLVGVRTPEEVAVAAEAAHLAPPEETAALLAEFATAYPDPMAWAALRDDPRPWVRAAARRSA